MKVLRGRLFFVRFALSALVSMALTNGAWAGVEISPELLEQCVRRVMQNIKAPVPQPASRLPSDEAMAAYKAMLTGEKARTAVDRQAIVSFKSKNKSPRNLDLLSPSLAKESPEFHAILQHLLATKAIEWEGGSQLYRLAVMTLKKGDWIHAGDLSLQLGEFIGAGNMTHIFAVEGDPTSVVRIPFNIFGGSPWNSQRKLKEFVDMYPDLPKKVPHVVLEVVAENYAFATVSRVTGWMNGRQFLEDPPQEMNPMWAARAARLRHLIHLTNPGERLSADYEKSLARQFLWDVERSDWILVDWEGLLSS